jgi:hypothetical protein
LIVDLPRIAAEHLAGREQYFAFGQRIVNHLERSDVEGAFALSD